jgi:hypothetical protein
MNAPGPDFLDLDVLNDQAPPVKVFNWLSLIQFGVSLISGMLFIGVGALSGFVMLLGNMSPGQFIPQDQVLSSYMFSSGLVFAGLLMIPSIFYSGKILFRKQPSRARDQTFFDRYNPSFVIFPLLILAGYLSQTGPTWAQDFLPVIHPLANTAAVFWVLNLVYRKSRRSIAGRFWGAFGSGLTVIPLIAFVTEIIILLVLGFIWLNILSSKPGLVEDLLKLVDQFQNNNVSPALLEESTSELFSQSGIAATAFLYIAVLVPIVEELLKPLVLWFTLGRKLTPREGFLLGAASGAGFALFENLTIGAAADIWTFVTISRIGTAAVHILTSGLVGWGITSAISENRYLRLLGAYVSAVMLHGIWNGLNILNAIADLPSAGEVLPRYLIYLADYAPIGLILLALGCFIGLLRVNSWIRRAIMSPSLEKSEV